MGSKNLGGLILLLLLCVFFVGCSSPETRSCGEEGAILNPFEGKKVVQIGIVVGDVEKYAKKYADFFGVEVPEIIWSEPEEKARTRYHGKATKGRVKQAFFHFDNISVELLEPVGGPSTWQEFLEEHGEGVHHIAFEIKGMDGHIAAMEGRGAGLIQQGRWTGGSGGRYAYFESERQLGVILELLENF